MVTGFSLSTPAISAANPTVTPRAISVHHIGERVVNSLIRSTASRVIGSLPTGDKVGGGSETGVVLDRVAGELDEGFLERAALRAQLVQHGAVGRGDLTDLLTVHSGHNELVAVVLEVGRGPLDRRADHRELRAAHHDGVLRGPVDELLGGALRDQLALADH